MITFTQSELYDAIQQYVQDQDALLSQANSAAVEWRFANDQMFGLFPLFTEIGFRGSNQWEPAERAWFSEMPTGICYEHGIDSDGKCRLIKRGRLTTLFVYSANTIDEMLFRDREPAPRALKRHLLENGRVVAFYEYCVDPHQYSLETFEFNKNQLIKSVENSWFINSEDEWVKASWSTTCTYEYDPQGLIRAFSDMGESLGGNKLVYVRPGSGSLHGNTKMRRPFFAYTIEVSDSSDDSEYKIYSDAYGLEMNIDDEWPVDTILLVHPSHVRVITDQTDVTSMGTVFAGASSLPTVEDLTRVQDSGGTWVLLDATDLHLAAKVRATLDAQLSLILSVTKSSDIPMAFAGNNGLSRDRLVVAICSDRELPPSEAQVVASKCRAELRKLNCEDSRIVIASRIGKDKIMDYMTHADVDGVLHFDGDFGSALDVLVPIALHSQQ